MSWPVEGQGCRFAPIPPPFPPAGRERVALCRQACRPKKPCPTSFWRALMAASTLRMTRRFPLETTRNHLGGQRLSNQARHTCLLGLPCVLRSTLAFSTSIIQNLWVADEAIVTDSNSSGAKMKIHRNSWLPIANTSQVVNIFLGQAIRSPSNPPLTDIIMATGLQVRAARSAPGALPTHHG